MELKLPFYPEFSKELKPYLAASCLYGFIIKESEENFKAVKNLSCEGSAKWFSEKLYFSLRTGFLCLKELSQKGFIRIEDLNPKDRSYKDQCHITHRYIPLRLPSTLRDKYKEVV